MATEPRPMDPERLADARAFSRAWRGERDESGDLIEGPEWDTDDIVWALRDLLADRDYHAQRAEHFATVVGAMAELARGLQSVAVAAGWPVDMPVEEPCELAESVAELRRHAEIGRQWEEDSSLERWFPLTAERLAETEASLKEARSLLEVLDRRLVERQQERDDWARKEHAAVNAKVVEKGRRMQAERRADELARLADDAADALTAERGKREAAEAEIARLRSRVRVEAEDVERAGVSWAKVRAWLERAGWSKSITSHGWRFKPEADGFTGVTVSGGAHERARAVTVIAAYLKRPDLDILDEMAAMPVELRPMDPGYWEAKAIGLGLTRAKVEAWLGANGWVRATSPRAKAASEWRHPTTRTVVFLRDDPGLLLAAVAGSVSKADLDEMARMPTESSPG